MSVLTIEELLTIQELSGYLKISEKTLYSHAMKRIIPGIRIGSSWRFRTSNIGYYLTLLYC